MGRALGWLWRLIRDTVAGNIIASLATSLGLTALLWDLFNAVPRGAGAVLGLSACGLVLMHWILHLPVLLGRSGMSQTPTLAAKRLADLLRRGDELLAQFIGLPRHDWLDFEAAKAENRSPRATPEFLEFRKVVMDWHAEVIEAVREEISEIAAATVEVVSLHLSGGDRIRLQMPGELPDSGSRDPYYLEGFVRALVHNLRDHLRRFDPVSRTLAPGAPEPLPPPIRRGSSEAERERTHRDFRERLRDHGRHQRETRLRELCDEGRAILAGIASARADWAVCGRELSQRAFDWKTRLVKDIDQFSPAKGVYFDVREFPGLDGQPKRLLQLDALPHDWETIFPYVNEVLRRFEDYLGTLEHRA